MARSRPMLQVVGGSKDVIALSKPSMMPVHSCGKYGRLSALEIAGLCDGRIRGLRPANRIDLATSGVFLAARSSSAAKEI